MKPQAMGSQEFFLALCKELDLSPTDSDEETIVKAVARVANRSKKLSKMGRDAQGVWSGLPDGTKLPSAVENILRWLIKS